MWMWNGWRWMLGEVTFCARGGLCERFLNKLLEEEKIPLWDIRVEDSCVTASCRARDYRAVRRPARGTGTRVHAVSRRGFFFRFRRLLRRGGLPVGAALALVLYMTLASFVWVIDVQTEDPALRARVEEALAACGLYRGMASGEVDLAAVRMRAIAQMEDLQLLTVYLDGCAARVEVRLREEGAPAPDNTPSNVVAAHDGRVLEMRVSSGQAMVKAGDAVVKGDLLVCGAIDTAHGLLLKASSAIVTAQTERELSVSVALTEERTVDTTQTVLPSLRVLWWCVPLYSPRPLSDDVRVTTEEHPLEAFGTALPLAISQTVCTASATETVRYTKAQAETIAKRRLQAVAVSQLADATIESVTYRGAWEGETYHLKATYVCTEDIAVKVPLLTDFE